MFYGQFQLDKVIHDLFFLGKKNGFFVECGAFDGLLECTCKFFEESLEWTGVNIEPVPILFNKLIVNRPNCRNLNIALSDDNCIREFTQAIHPEMGNNFGNGSISHSKFHYENLVKQGCCFCKFPVQCCKFSDLKIKEPIDLFVLDVEGHEIPALKGIIESTNLPKIFCIEFTISGLDEISRILPMYTLHSIYENNVFYVKK